MSRYLVESGSWTGKWMVYDHELNRVVDWFANKTTAQAAADELNALNACRR